MKLDIESMAREAAQLEAFARLIVERCAQAGFYAADNGIATAAAIRSLLEDK